MIETEKDVCQIRLKSIASDSVIGDSKKNMQNAPRYFGRTLVQNLYPLRGHDQIDISWDLLPNCWQFQVQRLDLFGCG